MSDTCNIYCDESCHLENDKQDVMVLGAVWQPKGYARKVAEEIRAIKACHNLPKQFEIKWTKVSESKQDFYLDIVDYFFNNQILHFRALVVCNKSKLRHDAFCQSHDTWYYKMYYHLLNKMLIPKTSHMIYLDMKDTRSAQKTRKLKEVLRNANLDFNKDIVARIQTVKSDEVEQIQLADLLIGVVSYVNRGLDQNRESINAGKLAVINKTKGSSGYSLKKTTLMREEKFNIFIWTPRKISNE